MAYLAMRTSTTDNRRLFTVNRIVCAGNLGKQMPKGCCEGFSQPARIYWSNAGAMVRGGLAQRRLFSIIAGKAWSRWRQAVQSGEPVDVEFRLQSSGGRRWTIIRATPVRNMGGAICKWVCSNIDITGPQTGR